MVRWALILASPVEETDSDDSDEELEVIDLVRYLGLCENVDNIERPKLDGLQIYPSETFYERMKHYRKIRTSKNVCLLETGSFS